jgi:uncharacterized protein
MIYVDTSVLLAYYCPERISVKAEKIIIEAVSPTISLLTEVEFASAVARKFREKYISEEATKRILTEFQTHLRKSLYNRIHIEVEHYNLAFNWLSSLELPLSTLDALHLAASSTNNLEMITADKQLSKAARKLGIGCRLIN